MQTNQNLRILLIEDDPTSIQAVAKLIKSYSQGLRKGWKLEFHWSQFLKSYINIPIEEVDEEGNCDPTGLSPVPITQLNLFTQYNVIILDLNLVQVQLSSSIPIKAPVAEEFKVSKNDGFGAYIGETILGAQGFSGEVMIRSRHITPQSQRPKLRDWADAVNNRFKNKVSLWPKDVDDLFEQRFFLTMYNVTSGERLPVRVNSLVQLCAFTDDNVLILGPTGSGKGWVAERIHKMWCRRYCIPEDNFVQVNCADFSEERLRAELFGFVKGRFNGLNYHSFGKVLKAAGLQFPQNPSASSGNDEEDYIKLIKDSASAAGIEVLEEEQGLLLIKNFPDEGTRVTGTLFLDEIGELPIASQVKLLRLISNDREISPVGLESKAIRLQKLRIIAATSNPHWLRQAAGYEDVNKDYYKPRADVFYRLAIHLIPLEGITEDDVDVELGVEHENWQPEAIKHLKGKLQDLRGHHRQLRSVIKMAHYMLQNGKLCGLGANEKVSVAMVDEIIHPKIRSFREAATEDFTTDESVRVQMPRLHFLFSLFFNSELRQNYKQWFVNGNFKSSSYQMSTSISTLISEKDRIDKEAALFVYLAYVVGTIGGIGNVKVAKSSLFEFNRRFDLKIDLDSKTDPGRKLMKKYIDYLASFIVKNDKNHGNTKQQYVESLKKYISEKRNYEDLVKLMGDAVSFESVCRQVASFLQTQSRAPTLVRRKKK